MGAKISRVCLITGAGQGIGAVLAHYFAAKGDRVVVAERHEDRGNQVVEEILRTGGQAIFVKTDVGDPASVNALCAAAKEHFGPVQILISNARRTETQQYAVEDLPDDEWEQTMRTNVTGAFNCIRRLVPDMKAANWGRIIIMSSSTALQPPMQRKYVHYITSKSALIGMARALSRELGPFGVTINALLPGSVSTGVERAGFDKNKDRAKATQSIPRLETPDDLTGAAYFLASNEASFITGQSIPVDGGFAFV